jgi:hypothetical protein
LVVIGPTTLGVSACGFVSTVSAVSFLLVVRKANAAEAGLSVMIAFATRVAT